MTTTVRIAALKRVPMDSMRKTALVADPGSARRRGIRPCFEAPGMASKRQPLRCRARMRRLRAVPKVPGGQMAPPCPRHRRSFRPNHAAATPQANRYRELT
jgi:hypothetical protein